MTLKKRKRVKVRCLGPKRAEHWFLSRDPSRERICRYCRRLQDEQDCPRTYTTAMETPK